MSNPRSQRPSGMPCHRYQPFPVVDLPDRQWPSRTITAAPRWLSTDLRDGNQALIDPMNAAASTRCSTSWSGWATRRSRSAFRRRARPTSISSAA